METIRIYLSNGLVAGVVSPATVRVIDLDIEGSDAEDGVEKLSDEDRRHLPEGNKDATYAFITDYENIVVTGETKSDLHRAIADAKRAFVGESNDAEHDALRDLLCALDVIAPPDCDCDERSWHGEGHDSACPVTAWLETNRQDAKLVSLDSETHDALVRAIDMLRNVAGGHGDIIDLLSELAAKGRQ